MDMRAEISGGPRFAVPDRQSDGGQRPSYAEAARPYDLKKSFESIRRRLAIIVFSFAFGGILSAVAGFVIKPTFTATAILTVQDADEGNAGRNGDVSVDTQLAMLQSPAFIERAFEAISRDDRLKAAVPRSIDLQRHLKVLQELRSRVIAVTFSAKSPSNAADIANTVARLFVEDPLLQGEKSIDDASDDLPQQIAKLEAALRRVESQVSDAKTSSPAESAEASELRDQVVALKLSQTLARRREENRQQALAMSPPVQLVALAQPPSRPSSLSPILIAIPTTILSGIFGVALALLLGRLDRRIHLPSDLIENSAFANAGAVPPRRRRSLSSIVRRNAVVRGYLRAIDLVVTRTLLMQRVSSRTVLITTCEHDTEASEIALDFASAAARMGRRVLLIDMDAARRARRTRGDRKDQRPTIFDVLAGRCPPAAAIQSLAGIGLDYVPGRDAVNIDMLPLIASGRLKQLIAELGARYDFVILSGPQVIGGSEVPLIATAVDAAILIVRSGRSLFPDVKDALDTLASSMPSPDIFTVLIDAPKRSLPPSFRDDSVGHSPRRYADAIAVSRWF
jgi:polysaccharide biosynthesis transport protein